ncbi:MAG: HD domain-containing protein [Cryomorphaceae bacterium]
MNNLKDFVTSDQALESRITEQLARELSADLVYHSARHTSFVIECAEFLAKAEGLSDEEVRLVRLAALYHDTGFLKGSDNHEEKSCKIAEKDLANHGLHTEEIEEVCSAIMATKIPQRPVNSIGKVLADADLFYLGTDRYAELSERLYAELKNFNPRLTDAQWLKIQRDFLAGHRYHTRYGREVLEPVKQENLRKL